MQCRRNKSLLIGQSSSRDQMVAYTLLKPLPHCSQPKGRSLVSDVHVSKLSGAAETSTHGFACAGPDDPVACKSSHRYHMRR
jgi:hypothetical protein